MKKKTKTDRPNPRTDGKKSYTDKITHRNIHVHTHKKRKRGKHIYIIAPKVQLLNLG